MDLNNRREDYTLNNLDEVTLIRNPFAQFEKWYKEAEADHVLEPNAMTLATVSKDGIPSARIVLLKSFDESGFVFFTNYESAKAKDIAENPNVALVFLWKEQQRQVRITGTAMQVQKQISEDYFLQRPYKSQIGAWASPQSHVIPNRAFLEQQELHFMQQFKDVVPMPAHWGGYIVIPVTFEFWQGRSGRLHDRIQYLKQGEAWTTQRLAP